MTEHIVMVTKKQFDMIMGGDQESDSTSSLTIAITNIKIEPPDQGNILEDTNTRGMETPEGAKNDTNMITLGPGTVTDEQEVPSANNGMLSTVPMPAGDPNAQTALLKPANMQINPDHSNFLLNLPCALTDESLILHDAYAVIMDMFFLQICVRHVESLVDLNTCQAAVNKTVQTWTNTCSDRLDCSGPFPGCHPTTKLSTICVCVCKCCDGRSTMLRRITSNKGQSMLRRRLKPRQAGRKQYEQGSAELSIITCSRLVEPFCCTLALMGTILHGWFRSPPGPAISSHVSCQRWLIIWTFLWNISVWSSCSSWTCSLVLLGLSPPPPCSSLNHVWANLSS